MPLWGLIGILPGALVGVAVVFLGGDPFYDESYDDRAGLGSIILVLLAAGLGFAVAALVAGFVIGIRLPLTWPRRVFFMVVGGCWVPIVVAVGVVSTGVAAQGEMPIVGLVGALSFLVCVVASLAALEATTFRPSLLLLALGVGLVALTVGYSWIAFRGVQQDRFQAAGTPVGVIDRQALDQVLSGWTVEKYEVSTTTSGAAVLTTNNDIEVRVSFGSSEGRRSCPSDFRSCVEAEPLDDGSRVWVLPVDSCDDQDTVQGVEAHRPTGHWEVSPVLPICERPRPSREELEAVLSIIEPVSVEHWFDQAL